MAKPKGKNKRKPQGKQVFRFVLDADDPLERELAETLLDLTGRYRFSDFMRQLLTMTLTPHYHDAVAAMMHRPPHEVIPYQKPARQSSQTIKAIEQTIVNAEDALAAASANFVGMFG